MRGVRSLAAFVASAVLVAHPGGVAAAPRAPLRVAVTATSADASRRLTRLPDLPLVRVAGETSGAIVIDARRRGQPITGYGAAMTDASAELIAGLTPPIRGALLRELFGREGLHLGFVRVPIGASDFSREHYSLDDMPAGERDPALARFSMARPLAAQVPMLRAARAINPNLALMASPWSAPGWMKTTGSLIKGSLKPENEPAFAAYFVRYLDAMEHAGVPVRFVSMQNEPAFEPENYPGMRVSPEQRARFFANNLGPALARRRTAVTILDWDHNWDMPNEPARVLASPAAARFVGGVAWHCYGGDPRVMAELQRSHPALPQYMTECSGGNWAPDWAGTLGWMTDKLIIAPTRAGSRGTLLWNLALDQDHGPHRGGCGDCRAVVTIDTRSGAVTRNVEYYVLGQVSRFVAPGAAAVPSSGGPAGVEHAAFVNRDGSRVLLVHNGGRSQARVTVADGGAGFAADVPAGEVVTFAWPAPRRLR